MKRIFSLSIIITVIVSLFSPTGKLQNYTYANSVHKSVYSNNPVEQSSIGILSTSVYPDNAVVKYGEKIYINYSFNDKAHPVLINIYKDGDLQSDYYYEQSSWGDHFSYEPKDEGSYRFVVQPTDQPYYTNECTVTVYKDRIIFLPGIMGSELFLGDEQVWEPENSKNLPRIRSQINSLQMTTLGESKNNISVHNSISDYDDILAFFKNEGFHVVDFPYDWRLGSSINAQKLKERINIERAASPYSNYYIVAHSMGGIVATEFIRQGNSNLIKKMITIGTPFLGAPQAINMLETGNLTDNLLAVLLAGDAVKNLEKNVPSIYELLPTKDYFSYQTNGYIETQTYQDPYGPRMKVRKYNTFSDTESYIKNSRDWSNNGLFDKAKDFHSALDVLNTLKKVDSYFIVGDQKTTPGKLVYHSLSINDKVLADVKSIQGDGVVPVSSATVGFKLDKARTFYITRSHLGLVKSTEVQQKILKILKDKPNEFVSDKIRNETKEIKTIKFKAECPVELHINDSSGNHTGPTGAETFESNIPDINYFTDGETKIALVNDVENYKVRIVGTGYGELTFSIVWSNEKDIEDRTMRFDNVAVTPGSIFKADVNQNGQVVLQIDQNGDGNFEGSVSPTVELDLGGTQDETIPTISSHVDGVKGINEWYGKNAFYNLTGADNASGVYKTFYDLNDSEFKEYNEPIALPNTGIYNFKSYVRDKNRNDSEVLTEIVKVDTTSPTVPVMTVDPTTWTNKFVTITLDGGTDADSGFQKYQYKINQDGEWKDYKDPFVIDTEGLYNVYARSVDNVFNLSGEVTGVTKVDKTNPQKPLMKVEPLKWTNQSVEIMLSGGSDTDKGFPNSGFQKYQYKIGLDGEWKDYTVPFIIDNEGLNNVYARAVDIAANLSDEVFGDAKVDKTRPSKPTGFDIDLFNYDNVRISWSPSSDNVGVTGYDIYQDSILLDNITDTAYTFNNLESNKSYTFKVIAWDEAGNSSLEGVNVVRTPLSLVGTGRDHSLHSMGS
ncbi:OmpL47-type beta-barrel domain-containing protein [Paenibacillus sp. FSL L8-0506]|uniref:OmpL47-type beta-barrel domain-containing protein n=1 Tax=Paenibacillus sp. FSL L8-0506 TaxID=2975335 RepID=UPI0030F527CA